jgi:RNA-directed DNA polymerase
MLTALERGVKGGIWFSLIDKVSHPGNLLVAFRKVKSNGGSAGVDRQTIGMFEKDLEGNLERLEKALKDGSYRPQSIRRTWIPKPGSTEKRPLGIPTVRDRVVQAALRNVIEPIFEREFTDHSYGFRPEKGCKDGLRKVDHHLKEGCHWVVDADLKSYFDTIPHDCLMALVREKISDGRVLDLIQKFLDQDILDGAATWTPIRGTPQGAIISPLLANLYLHPLDLLMESLGYIMIRYADDFIILCRSEEEARRALEVVRTWTEGAGLTLHPVKTQVVDANQPPGFDFLGYHFQGGKRWPRKKSILKLREAVRLRTPRNHPGSLETIIKNINPILRGWFEYFKHSPGYVFRGVDSYIRMRLRAILRRRSGRKGRERWSDHIRWPNSFFKAQGLFSMFAAHDAICQSSRR